VRVAHRNESALQTLVEELPRPLLLERLLRPAVGDELDSQEEPAASDVADDLVSLLHELEPREHRLADAVCVFGEPLLDDDL
jgi:hypothetical protein